jgi:hypothetical protein
LEIDGKVAVVTGAAGWWTGHRAAPGSGAATAAIPLDNFAQAIVGLITDESLAGRVLVQWPQRAPSLLV